MYIILDKVGDFINVVQTKDGSRTKGFDTIIKAMKYAETNCQNYQIVEVGWEVR